MWAWALALAAVAPAQLTVRGLVRAAPDQEVGGAVVRYLPIAPPGLEWAPAWAQPGPVADAATEGQADAQGRFHLRVPTRRGLLLVTTPNGLAALSPAAAGAPLRVDVGPVGTIHVGASARRVDVACADADGRLRLLGQRVGPSLSLPPGSYALLVHEAEASWVHRCEVTAGATTHAIAPPHRYQLRLDGRFRGHVHLRGWSAVRLPTRNARVRIRAAGPVQLVVHERQELGWIVRELWLQPGERERTLPRARAEWQPILVQDAAGAPLSGARVHTVQQRAAGPVVVATSIADPAGRAVVAALPGGDTRHALVARSGSAPSLLALEAGALAPARLAPAHTSTVTVRDPAGHQVTGARVALSLAAPSWLTWSGVTDARGRVTFEALPSGRARLELRSRDHLPAARDIAIAADAEGHAWQLLAEPGFAVHGQVRRQGQPLAGATVTLRDPTRADQGRVLTTQSAGDGGFEFRGLRRDGLYTLFASVERHGVTWSAQIREAQPGDTQWVLLLESEDPKPPWQRSPR